MIAQDVSRLELIGLTTGIRIMVVRIFIIHFMIRNIRREKQLGGIDLVWKTYFFYKEKLYL